MLLEAGQLYYSLSEMLDMVGDKPEYLDLLFKSGWILEAFIRIGRIDLIKQSLADPENSRHCLKNEQDPVLPAAINSGNLEFVQLLADHGALKTFADCKGERRTALSVAVTRSFGPDHEGHENDPDEKFQCQIRNLIILSSPLAFATLRSNVKLFDLLIECGAKTSGFGYSVEEISPFHHFDENASSQLKPYTIHFQSRKQLSMSVSVMLMILSICLLSKI